MVMAQSFRDQLVNQLAPLEEEDHGATPEDPSEISITSHNDDNGTAVPPPTTVCLVALLSCDVHGSDIQFLVTQLERQRPRRNISLMLEFVGCRFVEGVSSHLANLLYRRYDSQVRVHAPIRSIVVHGLNLVCFGSSATMINLLVGNVYPNFPTLLAMPKSSTLATLQISWLGIPLITPLTLLVQGLRSNASHCIQTFRLMIRRCQLPPSRETILGLLGELVRSMSRSKTSFELVLSCMPNLFAYEEDFIDPIDGPLVSPGSGFVEACHDFPPRSGLALRNVGVSEQIATNLCRALVKPWHAPRSLMFLHISGRGFVGRTMLNQLLESLVFAGNIHWNWILKDKSPTLGPILYTNHKYWKERLFAALSRNRYHLPWLKFVFGSYRFAKHSKMDRNRLICIQQSIHDLHLRLALAQRVLARAPWLFHDSHADRGGLLAHILAKLGDAPCGRHAVYLLLVNLRYS